MRLAWKFKRKEKMCVWGHADHRREGAPSADSRETRVLVTRMPKRGGDRDEETRMPSLQERRDDHLCDGKTTRGISFARERASGRASAVARDRRVVARIPNATLGGARRAGSAILKTGRRKKSHRGMVNESSRRKAGACSVLSAVLNLNKKRGEKRRNLERGNGIARGPGVSGTRRNLGRDARLGRERERARARPSALSREPSRRALRTVGRGVDLPKDVLRGHTRVHFLECKNAGECE